MRITFVVVAALLFLTGTARPREARLPILFVCGDSTANSRPPIQGWGDPVAEFIDPGKMTVENHAMGGRSSRTFVDEGRWEAVRAKAQAGDIVLIQFGHNDTKGTLSLDRYTLPGLGDEQERAENPKTHAQMTVRTFGYHMRKMISEGKATGATVVVLSPVPRCKWAEGKIVRGEEHHGEWAEALAREGGVKFVDVNATIAGLYDAVGQGKIKAMYFPQDNTHTNPAGAKVNAACVLKGLEEAGIGTLTAKLKAGGAAEIDRQMELVARSAATMPASRP